MFLLTARRMRCEAHVLPLIYIFFPFFCHVGKSGPKPLPRPTLTRLRITQRLTFFSPRAIQSLTYRKFCFWLFYSLFYIIKCSLISCYLNVWFKASVGHKTESHDIIFIIFTFAVFYQTPYRIRSWFFWNVSSPWNGSHLWNYFPSTFLYC